MPNNAVRLGPRRAPREHAVKKLINDTADVVKDSLRGVAAAHPELSVDVEQQIVVRGDAPVQGKVGLVSGGGSGHEPLHGGFVGAGMLDAAIAGEVFTSPVPDQILAATKAVSGGAGVVHIVKNYTGDVLNFQLAAELADEDGVKVESVLVNDDVAVQDSLYTAGRRGTGATVMIEKIAGALAEEGADLGAVTAVGRKVNERSRSFGIALTSCTVPAAGSPTFDLGDDEIEIGVGIHGEPGRERRKIGPASELAEVAAKAILDDMPVDGDDVLVFVNGFGGTPLIELYLVYGEVVRILGGRGITIARSLVGNYITSLDMAGFSLTITRLDDELTRLWDAPVNTPGLRWGG
jgi:phosphoenolpyruvate---glycerone phosphotransferase subunit DhaK